MASKQSNKNSASSNRVINKRNTSSNKKADKKIQQPLGTDLLGEIKIIVLAVMCVLMFISNFGAGGFIGNAVSSFLFGLMGIYAYVFPCVLLAGVFFAAANRGSTVALIKIVALIVGQAAVCGLLHGMLGNKELDSLFQSFSDCAENHSGGGFIGAAIYRGLFSAFGTIGAVMILLTMLIICIVLVSERSFLRGVQSGSAKVNRIAKEESERIKGRVEERKEERERRTESGVPGAGFDLKKEWKKNKKSDVAEAEDIFEDVRETAVTAPEMLEIKVHKQAEAEAPTVQEEIPEDAKPVKTKKSRIRENAAAEPAEDAKIAEDTQKEAEASMAQPVAQYKMPPLRLLAPPKGTVSRNNPAVLRETAAKLQQILKDFGVSVTVTDVSCGPSVTRYELQPDHGVKVSKILALADDIKLNLAVADIRIEAPIPGKAAVGIEVPNKENTVVTLRELLASDEFRNYGSNLAFAVGKDIGGKTIITDIAKMPHLLIAGATGSGKSVCINTLIMSLLYKSSPEDVRLIMVDPKVVELSAYNGIPHLLIPVVTDPKKAAGALNWAVAEMTRRYQLFAEYQVRNLDGYNAKVKSLEMIEDDNKPEKLPQIVIIVDELADLMMVAPGDVEDAICRLAQLARAAGIHLIIATQRPSVNVITGLIKANMPSRLAFAVSSGVDSRTILDMNGAEKLLGKGDMLFYPYGYPKPVRIQGAFVSDAEVEAVVSFLKENNLAVAVRDDIEEHIRTKQSPTAETVSAGGADEHDPLFAEAGKFIIEKDKASIGMLQRWFKIGFNRAARIMDQLAEAGVVGEEQGTKPREILMSSEQFEQYIEENI